MQKKLMTLEFSTMIFLLGVLISFGFVLLDGISLWALPRLGISYGGIRIPLTTLIFLRGIIGFIWFILFGGTIISNLLIRWHAMDRFRLVFQNPIWVLLAVNFLFLLFELYIFYLEPVRMTTTRISVQVPGLKQSMRIVQLSDIHVERTSPRERALPGLVNGLQPDMIVMTGDYLNENYRKSLKSQQDLKDLITQLHAPLGIYAVNGNVESRVNMTLILQGSAVQLIDNEIIRITQPDVEIALVGVEYSNKWYLGEDILENLMSQIKAEDYTILLYHSPDLAYAARDLGVDLYLTGHTHGGQFRLPFYGAIITDSRYGKQFEMGQYYLGSTVMYVSRGLGMAGGFAPRIRFLCPPEVVVIDLIPQQ